MASTIEIPLSEFECILCNEFMHTEIPLCVKGHSICLKCKNKCESCPWCQSKFEGARNYHLERLTELLRVKCPHDGCNEQDTAANITKHQEDCLFQEYDCPLQECKLCSWSGQLPDIVNHLTDVHNLNKVSCYKYENKIIRFTINNGNIFKQIFLHIDEDLRHIVVEYIGPKRLANLYKYCLVRHNHLNRTHAVFLGCVRSYCSDKDAFDGEKLVIPAAIYRLTSFDKFEILDNDEDAFFHI